MSEHKLNPPPHGYPAPKGEDLAPTIPDPTCTNCGHYLSGETCDKCSVGPEDLAEVELYKKFRKWRAAQRRPTVAEAWRAGYESGTAHLSSRCESLQALLRRAKPLVWCDRGCGCEGEALHDEIAALLEPKQDTKER